MSPLPTTRSTSRPVHFLPQRGWVGDVIPFAHAGRIWLFYLLEIRDDPASGTGWALTSTTDFVEYTDHGVVLPSGGADADDFDCYTGSVVEDRGTFHLFYTGHNPRRRAADGVTELQVVMHASSTDGLEVWRRHPEHTFGATPGYEPGDWRDPFVFRPAPDQPWRMLLAARHREGPPRRRGLVAQLVSDDLERWTVAAPFWDPRRYVAHECPDVFELGGWWYLVFSEFSESFCTRYRMARSPDGPWLPPEHDTVDGRAFYAAKSVEREGRRYLVGWIATREGDVDDGPWQWAGSMSVLEVVQQRDGTLAFALPAELVASFTRPTDLGGPGALGSSSAPERLATPDGYRAVVSRTDLPEPCYVRVGLDVEAGTRECGVLLRSSVDGDTSFVVRLEPHRGRMTFDRWPRRTTGPGQWEVSGDQPQVVELERPCSIEPGPHVLELLVDRTTCVAVLDGRTALSTRIYDHRFGRLGVFVGEGAVTFSEVAVRTRPTGG
ncbi:glycoside hydrolase family 32 protein [Microlunatus flavus]|uniref:beta-fructofuranosidase n=1 Tax=Microlunatus flavus TaxID=1036181 RepID=A0A1H9A6M8_9ACTN|nr:glycoside hydrolase family 32 protein [Microlunatus flavus]SEP72137.1 beta-fructofuranosidase [Microlunatus flavus]